MYALRKSQTPRASKNMSALFGWECVEALESWSLEKYGIKQEVCIWLQDNSQFRKADNAIVALVRIDRLSVILII